METTNPQYALGRKNEIISDLRALKEENSLDAIFFSVVDILTEKNTVFAVSDLEVEIIKSAFGANTQDFIADLGHRLSRKKELEPAVRKYFENN
jgi:manganese-dependent inorganic pyrophosphatase